MQTPGKIDVPAVCTSPMCTALARHAATAVSLRISLVELVHNTFTRSARVLRRVSSFARVSRPRVRCKPSARWHSALFLLFLLFVVASRRVVVATRRGVCCCCCCRCCSCSCCCFGLVAFRSAATPPFNIIGKSSRKTSERVNCAPFHGVRGRRARGMPASGRKLQTEADGARELQVYRHARWSGSSKRRARKPNVLKQDQQQESGKSWR